ncbi:MAG: 30S ribosomal protein S20 [Chloroflexi bacterium]|nr:30S ribosomal protein S20 [Chloroflexota bacterium]
MANIKSQIKRNRQNDKHRLRNRVYRGEARIAVRNARTTIEEGTPESKAALLGAIRALDKAAEQGVIHKNNAARRKSRLMKAFAKMEPVQVEAEPVPVEPVLEAKPARKKISLRTLSPKGKAAVKKVEEPKVEAAAEPKAEPKKKKAAAKKPVTKKAETTSSPKGKKPAAKKTETKKPVAKKTTTKTSSPKGKKPTATK